MPTAMWKYSVVSITDCAEKDVEQTAWKQVRLQARRISHHTAPPIPTDQRAFQAHAGRRSHPSVPPPWLHASQSSPKWDKLIPDSSRTSMRSFKPLFFRRWEIRNRTNKQKPTHSNLSTPILSYGGITNAFGAYYFSGADINNNNNNNNKPICNVTDPIWARMQCPSAI